MPGSPEAAEELGGGRVRPPSLRGRPWRVTVETTEVVMGRWAGGEAGPHRASWAAPASLLGDECPQACLSRPGCQRSAGPLASETPCWAGAARRLRGEEAPSRLRLPQWPSSSAGTTGVLCPAGVRRVKRVMGRDLLLDNIWTRGHREPGA